MQNNLSILFVSHLKVNPRLQLSQLFFNYLFGSMIFIAAFHLSALKTEADWDITKELNFDDESSKSVIASQDIQSLKPGETIERQIEAGKPHSYKITLEAGQSISVNVLKHSAFLTVETFAPQNKQYAYDERGANRFFAPIVIVAERAGDYRINVTANVSGTYSINSGIPRQATEMDNKHREAQKRFLEFWNLIRERAEKIKNNQLEKAEEEENRRKQLEKLEQRAAIYREIDDVKLTAIAVGDMAAMFYQSDPVKAINLFKEALELWSSTDEVTFERFDAIFELADEETRKGHYQKTIDYLNQALSLSRSKSFKMEEGRALYQLGTIYPLLDDKQKALDFYDQALSIFQSINPQTIQSIQQQAMALSSIGDLLRGIRDNEIVPENFNDRTNDERKKAIGYYQRSLEVYKNSKSITGVEPRNIYDAFIFLKIGNTYEELGNYAEALDYMQRAFAIIKDTRIQSAKIDVFRSLGSLYALKGEYQKSFEYYEQAVSIIKSGINKPMGASFLNNIAKDYYRAGETQKALDLLNEALTASRDREQQAVSAASLYEIARIERDLGNFNNARNRIEETLRIVESIRGGITALEGRASYFSTVKPYYDFYIDLLMQAHKSQPEKGFDEMALAASEKSRSRSLLDLLSQARIDIKQGVDAALLRREQQVRERLIEKANQQSRLLLGKYTKEEAEKIKAEVSNLTAEYEAVQAEIRNKSPRYAALTQPISLNAKQIQQLLNSGTVLLEYSLGEKKSYLWVVSSDSVTSFDLPSREEIEAQARKVYELLTVRNENPKGETDAQRIARIKAAEEEYPKAAAKLSRILLAPVASQIANKRLLIVPDGTLNYIPFSALPLPKSEESAGNLQLLSLDHEIVKLPSASILALLREETQNRKPAPKTLAVFADPVFNKTDVRANSTTAARTGGNAKRNNTALKTNTEIEKPSFSRDFERAISDVGLRSGESIGLPRLPFSRREADSIFKVAPKNLSLKEVDFDASKQVVFDSSLEQYRILHFATHGLLNSQHPELSGIVLSLVDKKGGEIDGFLRLQDIYNLKLSADLVVLSACNTALGKDVKGEGLIGLTRGFMYAGAPRVVASLWKVDDAATAEFMSIFYKKMLAENLRPAAALRAAQMEMMKQTRWKSPYYWAPFIIQGEWK